MNFSYPFIRRPIGTTLMAIGLFLVGAVAYAFLPVASLPSVDFPVIFVSASRPGADPNTMAATVAAPIERRLGEISGVNELTSVSSLGSSRIVVQFDLSRSIEGAARDVQAALNGALSDLPGDMPTLPNFRKANPAAAPILILALTSKTMRPSEIYDAADSVIAQRLSQVDGVGDVTVAGSEQPALRVRVDPQRLASMGLSMENVRTAIANANAVGPLGSFDGPHRAVTIGINDQLRNASDYDPVVVKTVDGTVIRLSNVATIRASVRNSRSAGWFNAQPVRAADHHQAGQRQCDRHGRRHLRGAAGAQAMGAGRARHFGAGRPHPDHPRQRARHAAHAWRHRHLGDAGGGGVPAPHGHHDRSRHYRAAVACRHLRSDVGGRLLDRQSVADGAGGLCRLRGRRRHRHDREHVPLSGARRLAVARKS